MNAKKNMAAALAAAVLASLLAVPARALPAPPVTPDTTVAQMRANEGIAGSGFNTWDRGTLFPEQPWQYGNWTLRRFVGPTVDETPPGKGWSSTISRGNAPTGSTPWSCPATCWSAPPAPRRPAARSASCTKWATPPLS